MMAHAPGIGRHALLPHGLALVVALAIPVAAEALPLFLSPWYGEEVGSQPVAVAVADVDGDGDLDLATANFSTQDVSVLRHIADATWTRTDYPAGVAPQSVALADLNGDARPDLITAHDMPAGVAVVRLNLGSGAFGTAASYACGAGSRLARLRDLDADGDRDLVVVNYDSSSVTVWKNAGNGTFANRVDYRTAARPGTFDIGDVNRDGIADIVTDGSPGCVLIGAPGGTFATPALDSLSGVLADVDKDGVLDLASTTTIQYGHGDGTFDAPELLDLPAGGVHVAVADVNADGFLDHVSTQSAGGTAYVRLGGPGGVFALPAVYRVGAQPGAVALANVTGSGMDLIVAAPAGNAVLVVPGLGDGTFAPVTHVSAVSATPSGVVVAELTGDALPDVAFSTRQSGSGSFGLCRQTAPLTFAGSTAVGSGATAALATGDLNGDALADVVVANHVNPPSTPVTVGVYRNTGGGTFAARQDFGVGQRPTAVVVADFDEDGKRDVATANSASNTVTVLRGDGAGALGTRTDFAAGGGQLVAADVNGDLHVDLLTLNAATLSVFLGDGDGAFAPRADYPLPSGSDVLAAADLDGDGRADAIVGSSQGSNVSVRPGQANGTLGAGTNLQIPLVTLLRAVDVDGDGGVDLMGAGAAGAAWVRRLGGLTFAVARYYGPRGFVAAEDLNGDGRRELIGVTGFGASPELKLYVLENLSATTGVPGPGEPAEAGLATAWPNPARTHLTVSFAPPAGRPASVLVHDLAGRQVRTLWSGAGHGARLAVRWDLRAADGARVRPGVYFVTLRAGATGTTRRVVIAD